MAKQVSQLLSSSPLTSNKDEMRPKADFQPSIWGDLFFICPDNDIDAETEQRHQQLEGGVRNMIVAPMANSTQKLTFGSSYLRVHGEDILDEAISCTTDHLTLAVAALEYPLSEHVSHALKQAIRRGLPRIEARHYLSVYQDIESHNKTLQEFAKIDFNMLQLLHRKELGEICRWWKDLDFQRKLPYVRDRVVEGYFWIMGVYFEPQYLLGTKILTKVIAMTSIIDDTYDSYATYDELAPYTNAIGRRQDDCLAIECYMEEYDVIAQEAYDVFNKHVESAWKDVNEGFLKPTKMPTEVLNRILNLARVMNVLYKEGDGYTYIGKATKGGINSLLIKPITL
ncbi:hypothetical protein J1N35_028333 [Gossypium stocksii]|uniref:Terpene synthase metal-binding domain-containing protein n=1 Tax=Gossypium stocksii TaxID=47602 RepID=A0A9D3UVQ0_9ROSI|nr:hypothetical protein J1N35_028333 [Gossypium stocksii]